jgi:L-aspartate oxidase
VRGEGAVLLDVAGRSVTAGMHPRGDLAPRDVVARAIASRLRETGGDHVFLDARRIEGFAARFPTITASCAEVGLDPGRDLIPVAPAAHYQCGGVVTDTWGGTDVPGLFAAGEVARTGLHGANRLASNSLLEGLVLGERAGINALQRRGTPAEVRDAELPATPRVPRPLLQQTMTAHAGVVRDADGLAAAAAALEQVEQGGHIALEDHALAVAAQALVVAATLRTESRGCHTRSDYPQRDHAARHSIPIRMDPDGRLCPAESLTGALIA